MKNPLRALVIGQNYELTMAIVPVLFRAGFEVELISLFGHIHAVDLQLKVHMVNSISDDLTLNLLSTEDFDLVVVGDDPTLQHIYESNLSNDLKLRLLPITSSKPMAALYSKIGLSALFEKFGIQTPKFRVANTPQQVLDCAVELGFPIIAKIDKSCGGQGVIKCSSLTDIHSNSYRFKFPLLIQEWIEGETFDLSAFYQGGNLVNFTFSKFEKVVRNEFGASSVRRYFQLGLADKLIIDELRQIGQSLCADGFVSITAIQSNQGLGRFYFEADMRPNVWVDYGKYIGNDLAVAIRDYFLEGKLIESIPPLDYSRPSYIVIPYIWRLSTWEVLTNKWNCWKFFSTPSSLLSYGLASSIKNIIEVIIRPTISEKSLFKLHSIYRRYMSPLTSYPMEKGNSD